MANIYTEKIKLRKQIISAANIYKNDLAGNVYLYVYGDTYFEVAYMTECFKHLTGVESLLSGNSFYDNAKNATLATNQFGFSSLHPLKTAKKKIQCLHQLPQLTKDLVCVVKDMHTVTITYKLGITNLDFTIGLTENRDFYGNKVNDWFLPRTLRVKDKAIENSKDANFIDFIFSKNASSSKYDTVNFASSGKAFPNSILEMLSENIKAGKW